MSDRIITFCLLLGSWVVLSGQFDAFHLLAGVFCALLVTVMSGRMMWFSGGARGPMVRLRQGVAFAGFLGWLVWQIVLANCYMIFVSLHPRGVTMLTPRMVRFRTRLKSDFARFALANSITLTPGTVTVRVEGDEFLVHALNERTAAGLPGDMEMRLARVFEPDVVEPQGDR